MELKQAIKMCKEMNARANVTVHISTKGEIYTGQIWVYGATTKKIITWKRKHGITTQIKKKYNTNIGLSDIDWLLDNVRFDSVAQCKIVGYKDVEVPTVKAHTKKVPIYDCNGKPHLKQ